MLDDATIWADLGCHRNGRRNAEENQEGRHQEAAADAEKARDETHRRTHSENQENADRHFGDREVNLHADSPRA